MQEEFYSLQNEKISQNGRWIEKKNSCKKFKSSFVEVLQYDDTFKQFRFKNFKKSFPEFIEKVKQKVRNFLQVNWGTIFDLIVKLENNEGEERIEVISTTLLAEHIFLSLA